MAVITITKENFEAEVLKSAQPVLLDFWAAWCGPCRMLSPIVDEVAEERTDVKVGKLNVDEQPDLAAEFGVMSIPTLLLFENGKLVRQAVGARPEERRAGTAGLENKTARSRCTENAVRRLLFCASHHLEAGFREIISPFCTNAQKNRIIKMKTRSLSHFTTLSG